MDKLNYFAYASNLDKKQMLARCPESKPKCGATLPNYKLVFVGWSRKWRGGEATLRRATGSKVPGAIYDVSEPCLQRLDRYEDTYGRFKVTVYDEVGNAVEAVAYIKKGQPEDTPPSKEYLAVIQQGYRDWGIE